MLVHRTKEKKGFWEFDSIMQNMSHLCTNMVVLLRDWKPSIDSQVVDKIFASNLYGRLQWRTKAIADRTRILSYL